jgi:hypothetical protein
MLDTRNIKNTRSTKFLDFKNIELFRIICAIDNIVYELKLSKAIIRIFRVFCFRLLYLDTSNLLLN